MTGTSRRLLVVDDNVAGRYLLCRTLSKAGFEILEAGSGDEALARLEDEPDLVLLDVHLPDVDGFAVCARLRTDDRFAHVPILMMSAEYQSAQNMAHGLDVGADAYLTHPVEPDVLLSTVRALLRVREAEAEVRKLNAGLATQVHAGTLRLAELNAEMAAYTRSLARDIQEPLRRVQGFMGLLRRRLMPIEDPQIEHYLTVMAAESDRVGKLVEDLAGLALSEGRALRPTQVPLTQLLVQVRSDLAPILRGRRVEWHQAELPTVTGDILLLRQAFTNLLHNAVKFTRHRELAVIETGGEARSDHVVVWVRDNGVGFDPQDAARLFEVFQRLHGDAYEGAGVGLANVRRIALRHGGRVWAEGQPGAGATFFLALPLTPLDFT
jgi:signal transduction histidine kinase